MLDKEYILIDMMLNNRPIEEFAELFESEAELSWGMLLHMCYCEESYESVGGDYGDEDDPPINRERLSYLEGLIAFLEEKGVEEAK